jgi:hypothetical protein
MIIICVCVILTKFCFQLVTILQWCSWSFAEIDRNTLHAYKYSFVRIFLEKRQRTKDKWVNILLINHFMSVSHHSCWFSFWRKRDREEKKTTRKERNSHRKHHPALQSTIIIALSGGGQSSQASCYLKCAFYWLYELHTGAFSYTIYKG